jgi:response regulator of citrate/malate metabolism
MPVISGWDFLDEYQTFKAELSKAIRIIIISSSDHPKDIAQSHLYEDVSDYVVKPILLERLKEIVGVNLT